MGAAGQDREPVSTPTPRPLLVLLAVVGGGSALGLAGPPPAALELALAASGVTALCALRAGGARGRRAALIALVALAAAVRGAGARPDRIDAGRFGAAPTAGRWSAGDTLGKSGRLAGGEQRFELAPGAVGAGELVLLSPGRSATRPARAPTELVPRSAGPAPELLVLDDELARLAPAAGGFTRGPRSALADLRARGLARVARLRDADARGLTAALLFGDRTALPMGVPDLFTRTGTRHALAISGLHVGLLAWILVRPLGTGLALLWRRRRGSAVRPPRPEPWRALLLALMVPLAGSGAPVLRAALALSLFELASAMPRAPGGGRRRVDGLSLWAAAATLECLVRPAALTTLSFQLSYAATLGLLLGTSGARTALVALLAPAARGFSTTTRTGRRLPAGVRVLLQRCGRLLTATLALSLAANLATLPLVWARFGEWSPVGLVATPLLVPLLAAFLGVGWLWMALPVAPLAGALEGLAGAMLGLLASCDRLPLTPAPLPPRPLWLLGLAALSGLVLLRGVQAPEARARLARAGAVLTAALLLPWTVAPRALELIALDVGHGTACVLRAPGAPCWIFDAGSRDRPGIARGALGPLLRRWDVARVAVVLSHADRDHESALGWVAERYPPETWLGALTARQDERLPHATRRFDLGIGRASFDSDGPGGLALTLVRGHLGEDNEGSRSLIVAHGATRILLCGDADGPGLAAALRRGLFEGPFDLVLQPHHGSPTVHLGPFLDSAQPALVWFSSSEQSSVAPELDRRGIPWRSTAVHGPLRYPGAPPPPARFVLRAGPHPTERIPVAPVRAATLPRKETPMSRMPMDLWLQLARPTWIALTAVGLMLPVRAQMAQAEPAQAPAGPADGVISADERTLERGRVFTLGSGQHVRGKSRWVADESSPDGGYWEVREASGWRALRAGSVASWRGERELLREADRLSAAVRLGEHGRRVALADWMVSNGLEAEALAQLDRVLRAEPDHDAALNLIARGAFSLPRATDERRDPVGAREGLIAMGVDASPARRELVIRALGQLADSEGLRAALSRELVVFRHQQRFFATHALRRLAPGEELRPLLLRAALDRSGEVRLGAALALRASGEEAVIVPLVRALGSEHGSVRTNAAESLGNVGFAAAVPALVAHMANVAQGGSNLRPPASHITVTSAVAYVGDFDVEIAQGASIADPQVMAVTEGVVFDARASGFVEHSYVTELVTVRRSLKQLTGHDAGRNPDRWQRWYEEHRTRYETVEADE